MTSRFSTGISAATLAAALLLSQATTGRAASNWTAPRTSDGHPDLQGYWTNAIAIPADVTSDDSVAKLFRACGPVDHVVVTAAQLRTAFRPACIAPRHMALRCRLKTKPDCTSSRRATLAGLPR